MQGHALLIPRRQLARHKQVTGRKEECPQEVQMLRVQGLVLRIQGAGLWLRDLNGVKSPLL